MWGQTCNYNEKENSFLIMMLPMYYLPLSWWQSKHPFKGTITEPILTSIFFRHHICRSIPWLWLWFLCLMPLSTIFQLYIVAVSFIGGANRSTLRKPLTCRKSLTNFITSLSWKNLFVVNCNKKGSFINVNNTFSFLSELQKKVALIFQKS